MKKNRVIILLGPPGSGKGTQSKFLREKFNLEAIGSGNLLRTRMKESNYTGNKIAEVINKGQRIPTPVIFSLWMNELENLKEKIGSKGFLFDGSPRTVFEAKMLEDALEWYDWHKEKKIIFINLSKKEVLKRLKTRKMCDKCGQTIAFDNSNRKICSDCGGELIVRPDDSLDGINTRWEWFNREVKPVVNYYKKKNGVIIINGNQSVDKVFKDILKKIK